MLTNEILKKLGLSKDYKGVEYIAQIIEETPYHTLFEINLNTLFTNLAEQYNTTNTSIKRDVLYAKKQHLKNLHQKDMKIIFNINSANEKLSTKSYLCALKIAIETNINNLVYTTEW